MSEQSYQSTFNDESTTENIGERTDSVLGGWTYRGLRSEEMPPLSIRPHELIHLDLSRLPQGIRLFVTDPWTDTKIVREDRTLRATAAVELRLDTEATNDPDEESHDTKPKIILEWQMIFPDTTDTQDILTAIDDGHARLRDQAERVGGRVERAGESIELELRPPVFPVDLRPRPPQQRMTTNEFLVFDLQDIPDLGHILVEDSEQPFLAGRIGDRIAAGIGRFYRVPTSKGEYHGKLIRVTNDGGGPTHTLKDNVDAKLGPATATHAAVYLDLTLTFPLTVLASEVYGTVTKRWQEMLDYVAALVG